MSPALEKQIADTLGAAQQTGSEALSFIKERAPILAEQIVRWELITNWLAVFAWLVGVSVVSFIVARFYKKDHEAAPLACFCGAFLLFMWTALLMCITIPALIKIYTAPDLVVLDYITNALRPQQ